MNRLLPLFCLAALCSAAATAPAKRPNFLFILTDDQDPDTLGAYGNTVCQTPSLDRLAREGMIFHDAHHMGSWSGAVCLPSRTMIMTGRTVWSLPNYKAGRGKGNKAPGFNPDTDSLPALFNRAGYDTFRTCKNGNSYPPANRQFKTVRDATKRGSTPETGSPWHADQVLAYLEKRTAAKSSDPFLIYFGFSHPHDPRNAPPGLLAKYGAHNTGIPATPAPKAPPLPPNYLPAHPFHHGHPGLRDEVSVQGVGKKRDEATVRNEIGRNYACIEHIDRQVGRVLDKLESMGELENTFIIFTSDHGIAVGRHGLMGKQNLYEHTWRVPFLARGPGIKPRSSTTAMIYLLDVLPTFCDLAGIAIPEAAQGRSFRPVLEGRSERHRDHVYGVYAGGTKPGMRAIKTGHYKLIKYDVLEGKVQKTQLFDLERNPLELLAGHHDPKVVAMTGHKPEPYQVNLAGNPEYAAIRKDLEKLLSQEMERLKDPYTLWDQKN